jgi:hypothetical protein
LASPELNVQVTADISALQAGMQSAVSSVASATANMKTAVQSVAPALDAVGKASQDLGNNVAGTLMDAAKQAQAAADELKRLAAVQFGDQTQDLKLQLDILRATDPVVKAQLEGRRQLAAIRREARDIDAKGADAAAREMISAKQLLAIEQMRQNTGRARAQIAAQERQNEQARTAAAQAAANAERQRMQDSIQLIQQQTAATRQLGQQYQTINTRGLGGSFDRTDMSRAAKGLQATTNLMQSDFSSTQATVMSIGAAVAMLPIPFARVVGLLGVAGSALYGLLNNTKELDRVEAERAQRMEEAERRATNAATVRDLERQLQIEKESDPIRKLRLEYARTMDRLTRELNENMKRMSEEEAQARYEAERRLEAARTENQILKERQKIAEDIADDIARTPQEATASKPATQMQALVSSVTTSLGGAFNFAQNPVLQSIQDYAIKQAGYQANLVLTAREILQLLRNQGTVIT